MRTLYAFEKHNALDHIEVRQEWPGAGYHWDVVDDRGRIVRRSGGKFYDVEDHPEGALVWAKRSAARYRRYLRALGKARTVEDAIKIEI